MIPLALATFLSAASPATPPPLLSQALSSHTEVRVLSAQDLRTSPYSVADLARLGYWPPWVSADLDADGRVDVAAVVVLQSEKDPEFGVVAIHARSAKRLQWVEPAQRGLLFGVALGRSKDTLTPLHCVECDSNPWYRWSGEEYVVGLFKAGEDVAIVTRDKANPPRLFKKPGFDSDVDSDLRSCASARVVRVKRSGRPAIHWYEVDLKPPSRGRGWILASWASVDCTWPP